MMTVLFLLWWLASQLRFEAIGVFRRRIHCQCLLPHSDGQLPVTLLFVYVTQVLVQQRRLIRPLKGLIEITLGIIEPAKLEIRPTEAVKVRAEIRTSIHRSLDHLEGFVEPLISLD